MQVSKQNQFGRFSARWGCKFTCGANIIEIERGIPFTKFERLAVLGFTYDSEEFLMANYKDHERIGTEQSGWDSEADPEWHFMGMDKTMHDFVVGLAALFDITKFKYKHFLDVYKTAYGKHFLLKNNVGTFNPDPSVHLIQLLETREVI